MGERIILPALRRLVPNLVLACASVLALALALEAALRAFWPQDLPFFSSLFFEDPAVGMRHVPLTRAPMASDTGQPVQVRINSRGYRGREYPWDSAAGFRILGLGDSFTFGYGVEEDDAYLARLERALADRRVEVINAGLAGMGPDNEARLLAADGPGLRPDLVLVGFYVGNGYGGHGSGYTYGHPHGYSYSRDHRGQSGHSPHYAYGAYANPYGYGGSYGSYGPRSYGGSGAYDGYYGNYGHHHHHH